MIILKNTKIKSATNITRLKGNIKITVKIQLIFIYNKISFYQKSKYEIIVLDKHIKLFIKK